MRSVTDATHPDMKLRHASCESVTMVVVLVCVRARAMASSSVSSVLLLREVLSRRNTAFDENGHRFLRRVGIRDVSWRHVKLIAFNRAREIPAISKFASLRPSCGRRTNS